jgi:class 3 adenylate cyclase/tetratricopeptide (TPR) repeat protein
MKCPKCQSENSAGSKFCSGCGSSLTILCPNCNHPSSLESKFCSMCGHPVAGQVAPGLPAEADAEHGGADGRRHATVMFSDLSGYTGLTERIDPEEVDQLVNRIKQAATRIIEKYRGTINQFVGDEVLALFGIPNAAEDDPVRAIKAALELHAEIRGNADYLLAQTDERLKIHTGINTGLIIAQYDGDREGLYRLTGDAVNTAARLRSLAEADQILIGPNTQRFVKFYFELAPCPPVRVKGKMAPIVPYHVIAESRISSRFEAARERGFKAYVGRNEERMTLQSSLIQAIGGKGQLVTIEGDPGIGKSRLLYEFLSGIDREQITTPQGRCQPYGSEIPYFSFLDGLRRGLHLSEHDNYADTLQKAVENIKRIAPSLETYLPHLLHLLSIPSDYALPADLKGEALRRAMEEAVAAVITLTTNLQPTVLTIEDWHWSDPASQSALRYLLRLVPSYRLMVVITYRSAYDFDFGKTCDRTMIRLKPLNEAEAEELIAAVTAAVEFPAGLAALICRSADGNPLFIEEACYSLLESGAISVADRTLVLHQSLDQLLLPDTVQAVIRARLDRLDDAAKDVVGRAAVIGRVFNQRVLARIYRGRTPLEESLETLQAQEIIQQTQILPEPEYSFRHVLTREVAYDTLLFQQRKQLHEAVGIAIEELYPKRLEENASILFHHFARSPRADKAVQYALLAGERASRLFANVEAARYFNDALIIAKSLPISDQSQRWQIDAILGQAAVGAAPGDIERDRKNLEHVCTLSEQLGDRRRLAQALYWLGRTHYVLADLKRAIEHAQKSLEIADELGDAALAAPPVNLIGRAYWQLSEFVRSAQMMERNVEQMRSVANRSEQSTAAGFLSALLGYMGEFEKALFYSDLSIKFAQELKNPYAEAAGCHYRGIIHDQQGRWDLAIAEYEKAQRIAEKAGDMFRIYIVQFMEGRAHQMAGDVARGLKLIEDSIALATKIGTKFLLGQAKSVLAACRVADGRVEEAQSLCTEAIILAEKAGDRFTQSFVRRTLAEVLARSGQSKDLSKARRAILEAIKIQEQIGAKPEWARSCVSLAWVLNLQGKDQEAASFLEKANRLFADLDMRWDIARAAQAFEPRTHVAPATNPPSAA